MDPDKNKVVKYKPIALNQFGSKASRHTDVGKFLSANSNSKENNLVEDLRKTFAQTGSNIKSPKPEGVRKFLPIPLKIVTNCSSNSKSNTKSPKQESVKKFLPIPLNVVTNICSNSKVKANTNNIKKPSTQGVIKKQLFKTPNSKSSKKRKNKSTPIEVDFKPLNLTSIEELEISNELETSISSNEFRDLEKACGIDTPQKSVNDNLKAAIQKIDNILSEANKLKNILVNLDEKPEVKKNVPKNNLCKAVLHKNFQKSGIKEKDCIEKFEKMCSFTPKPSRRMNSTPKSVRGKLLHTLAKQQMLLDKSFE